MAEVKTQLPARVREPHRRDRRVPPARPRSRSRASRASSSRRSKRGSRSSRSGSTCTRRGAEGGRGGRLRPGLRRAAAEARDPAADREPAREGDPRRAGTPPATTINVGATGGEITFAKRGGVEEGEGCGVICGTLSRWLSRPRVSGRCGCALKESRRPKRASCPLREKRRSTVDERQPADAAPWNAVCFFLAGPALAARPTPVGTRPPR